MKHWEHWREGSPRAWEWGAVIASVSGGVNSVRESLHALLGLWADFAGALVSLLTIVLLSLRLFDAVKTKKRRSRTPKVESCPPPPMS